MTGAPFALPVFLLAAALEIGGCWLIYAVVRLGWHPAFLAAGLVALAGFGAALTLVDTGGAGRTFAAYGGIYVIASLIWLHVVEGVPLRATDGIGAALVLLGALVVLFGARNA